MTVYRLFYFGFFFAGPLLILAFYAEEVTLIKNHLLLYYYDVNLNVYNVRTVSGRVKFNPNVDHKLFNYF